MQADSRQVVSSQVHVHRRLPELVRRHLSNRFEKPLAPHSEAAFQTLQERLHDNFKPLVLDSFCGTGQSTAELAAMYPNHLVVGVDKSAERLRKHVASADGNYLLLQANCEDIWHLLVQHQLLLEHHYLLYPNPWPKAGHVQRRVHGHPALRYLLGLGGTIELRSNWQVYVEEFGLALHLAGSPGRVTCDIPQRPTTLFEQKYAASGHQLWAFKGRLAPSDATQLLG